MLETEDIQAIVISSNLVPSGKFNYSDPRLERLRQNVFWRVRSNFVDTPTDCPTRERSGWTGDIQIFSPAATTFFDSQAYLRRYLRNLEIEQLPDGRVPPFIPSGHSEFSGGISFLNRTFANFAGWGDSSLTIPWTLYQYYGYRMVLARQYESVKLWVSHMEHDARTRRSWRRRMSRGLGELERYILDTGFQWGEWLRAGASLSNMITKVIFSEPAVSTAYFAHSSYLLSEIASLLGQQEDARHYAILASSVRSAWRAAFVHRGGSRIATDHQDDYVRALAFNLVEAEQREAVMNRLVELVKKQATISQLAS
jgi:alpha-L-rhamnosidase